MSTFNERATADVSGIFLRGDGFDVPALFTFSGDAGTSDIFVLFDENFEPTDQFTSEVTGDGPIAVGAASDLLDTDGNLPQSDAIIVIATVTYYVVKAMKYGDLVILQLTKEAPGGQDVDG